MSGGIYHLRRKSFGDGLQLSRAMSIQQRLIGPERPR